MDAAPAYNDVFAQSPGIIEVGCAHARRYFKEALPTAAVACAQALALIKQLYGIERVASDRQLDAPARRSLRQEQARPLHWSYQRICWSSGRRRYRSPLGAATGYALRNWAALTRYTEDGRLKIDNNGAEQALRPIVLGRKNWLFAGSEAAAHRTTILCSLVQTHSTCRSIPSSTCAMSSSAFRPIRPRLVLELTPRVESACGSSSGFQAAA